MYLKHLSLTNFRSFARLDEDVPRRIILLVGDNAQGKTSLLEAVYYLATFTSLLVESDRQLINFDAVLEPLAVARLVAEYRRGDKDHRLEVRLVQSPEKNGGGNHIYKEILLDGNKKKAADVVGHFNAVIFLPQMMRIIEEGPEERRRYLNLALSQAVPGYAGVLSEYQQALTQRNALLKMLNERGGDVDQLSFWDKVLAERGAQIIHARIAAVYELDKLVRGLHQRLTSHAQEVLRLVYQPAYDPVQPPSGQFALPFQSPIDRSKIDLEEIQQGFARRLVELRSAEISRGLTTIGPHRDDLRFISSNIDLGNFGSRGQARTALMALKLAEIRWLKQRTGDSPVLLFDEVLAELDTRRRADLLAALSECDQGMLTTTDMNLFNPDFIRQAVLWQVQGGMVSKTTS
jgi:DNA replication and repair protein RecF